MKKTESPTQFIQTLAKNLGLHAKDRKPTDIQRNILSVVDELQRGRVGMRDQIAALKDMLTRHDANIMEMGDIIRTVAERLGMPKNFVFADVVTKVIEVITAKHKVEQTTKQLREDLAAVIADNERIRSELSGLLGQSTALLSSVDIVSKVIPVVTERHAASQELVRAWGAKAESDAAAGKHRDNWASLRERVAHQLDIDETTKSDDEIIASLLWQMGSLRADKEGLSVRVQELTAKLPTEEALQELIVASYHAGATDAEFKRKMGDAWSRVDSLKDALLGNAR